MPLDGQSFAFHMSVAGVYLNPQGDPNQSLGGYRSSTRVEELESSVTTQVSDFIFRDSTQTGSSHVGKWIVFVLGTNAIDARQILYHDTGTGDIGVSPAWGTAPAVGEVYRISGALNLFDNLSVLECVEGHIDHRCLFLYNNTGSILQDIRFYLEPLNPSGTNFEVVAGNNMKGVNPVTASADEEDNPSTDTTGASGFTTTTPQRFRAARDYDSARAVPSTTSGFNLNNLNSSALWLRRTTPELTKKMDNAAWLLVAEQNTGVKTAVPLVFDLAGYTPQLAASFDRKPRTFGGARIDISVVDASYGFPIEDEEVYVVIDTGPGTLNSAPQPLSTDADGETYAIYVGPEDEAYVGSTVTVEAKMGGDL